MLYQDAAATAFLLKTIPTRTNLQRHVILRSLAVRSTPR